jgi:hypothetical protein
MNESSIIKFLEHLGCKRIRKRGDEINCSCPFPENHKHGDRHPSFGVRINASGVSPYGCFGCGERGIIERLARERGVQDFESPYVLKVATNCSWYPKPPVHKEEPVFFDDRYLKDFSGQMSNFFRIRGLSIDTMKTWELGYDHMFGRATIPVRDINGKLGMVTGRDVRGRSRAKYSNYVLDKVQDRLVPFLLREKVEEEFVRPTRNFFLYGEHRIGLLKENDDLIITEGPMDVLKLYEYGYYAVGIMGSSPSDRQISTLIEIKPPKGRLVIMADADKAGRRLSKELLSRLGGLPIVEAILPEGHDPGDSSRSEIDFSLENAKKP